MKRGAALTVSLLALLLATSCGKTPPLPTLSLDGVDPEVSSVVTTAQKQAMLAPDSGYASGHLGMVLQANSLTQPAILSYERAIRLAPKEFAWRYYLALGLQQMSEPEKALNALAGALRIRPDYSPAIMKRGELLFQLARFPESAAAYESVLAQDSSSADALYGLARVKQAQGEMPAAQDLYTRACKAYPAFGAAYYGLGTTARSLGHREESMKSFELAKQYYGGHPPAADPVLDQVAALSAGVSRHLAEADDLTKKGKMEEAAQLDERMLARDPGNLSFLLNLLYVSRFLTRLDGQMDDFYERAKRINPRGELVYDYYGVAKVRQGKYDVASLALKKAIELGPEDPEPYKFLGEIAERQNRPAEAIEQYRRALAAEPSDRSFQMKLWWTLIVHGRAREAIPELVPALPVDDSFTPTRMFLLGEAYRTTGDFSKSRQYLEQARERMRNQGSAEMLAQIDQDLNHMPPGH